MRWKRMNHWKLIRKLVDDDGVVIAHIQRGRRPHEYTIVFPAAGHHFHRGKSHTIKNIPDYTLTDSTLAAAKAVGILLAKTN
jgi:hypothetical protein